MTSRRWTALALGALAGAGCGSSGEQIAGVTDDESVFTQVVSDDTRAEERERLLLAIKAATAPYRNVGAALAAGYRPASPCVDLEYLVPAEAWHLRHQDPPHLMGQPFDDHRDPALRHGIPFAHYDLHLWIWRPNPEGMFTPFNPLVSCRFADD
jgi:hypothetical protein